MIRIKKTITDKRNGKTIRAYERDMYGSIIVFNSKADAESHIQFVKYCGGTSNITFKITGV